MAMPIAQTPAPTSLLASGGDGGGAGDADGEDWALALVLGVMLGVLLLGESVSVTPASPPLTLFHVHTCSSHRCVPLLVGESVMVSLFLSLSLSLSLSHSPLSSVLLFTAVHISIFSSCFSRGTWFCVLVTIAGVFLVDESRLYPRFSPGLVGRF